MYTRIDLTGMVQPILSYGNTLREAVDRANSAHTAEVSPAGSAAHIAIDRNLQDRVVYIESRMGGTNYKDSPELRAQLTRVRDQVRTRLIAAGQSPQPIGEPQTSLSQMIAELPDAVAERLARVLVKGKENPLGLHNLLPKIFTPGSDPVAVARWKDFLDTHAITFLGGSNTINFKVEAIPPLIEPPEVLKLEHRFGYPNRMDTVVRNAVPGLCIPAAASRMVLAPDPKKTGEMVGRSLMVTTLCTHGGAVSYAKRGRQDYIVAAVAETAATLKASGKDQVFIDAAVDAKIAQLTPGVKVGEHDAIRTAATAAANTAIDEINTGRRTADSYKWESAAAATSFKQRIHGVATQMCARLQDLEKQGIYFPDAKLSNWVVEGDGTLRVADTKSFKRSPPDVLDVTHGDNDGIRMRTICTKGYNSSDIGVTPEIIHRVILGRNIYYALTGVEPHDTTSPACTEAVFQGEVGAKYKDLIEALTKRTGPEPGKPQPTITLAQAALILREIEIMQAPPYALASVTQKAQMVALAADARYAAATPEQRAGVVELIANPIYEAAPAVTKKRMIEAMLTPAYAEIAAKVRDLNVLTGQEHTPCLLTSLHAACEDLAYDRDTALTDLRETANKAYDTMIQANTIRTAITALPQPTLKGQPLLPDALLVHDLDVSIGTPNDLNELVVGLEAHRAHLGFARDALPQIQELQGLSDDCNAQRFGAGDVKMDQFLTRARQDVLNGTTLVTRVANGQQIHGELTAACAGLCDAVNQSVHDNITRLRGKHFSLRGAKAKATAIEHAAAEIPIEVRVNLRQHGEDSVVRALFSEMGRERTLLGGLGATVDNPGEIKSYKHAMSTLRKPQPQKDELDRDNKKSPH